jgi:2,3-diketo-5-methylthiopentyl-1-phosphate enolase
MAAVIEVDYRFPAGVDARKQAQVIAVGQTAGSWDARFSHAEPSLRAHLAEVVKVDAQVATVRFPAANVEGDIASLLTMIFGKYSMAGPARVVDVRLPEGYGTGPRHGLAGIRRMLGVQDRPLIMAIFKPALGLSAQDHAAILREVAEAGLDVIKDDEILPNLPTAPTLERLAACRAVLDEVKAKTGRTVLYAVNVTGRADQVLTRARALVAAGANALLFNVLTHGYSVLESLARDPAVDVPIFAHPALAGALSGSADFGLDYAVVLGTLLAHAGADAVLYPAHYGSLPFEAVQEQRIREALRARGVAAVPSAGIHPGVVPRALADYGQDVVLNAGTGIMDHPSGPAAGVRAFFEALALERAQPQRGAPFNREAISPGPLRAALDKWGCG